MTLLAAGRTTSTSPLRAARGHLSTPYVDLDVAHAVRRYRHLAAVLPRTAVHYVVRANPHPALLAALVTAGCDFLVASPAEVQACLTAGASADDLVYSDPRLDRDDLAAAAGLGVRLFVIGSPEAVCHVALAAPGSSVLCRIVPARGRARRSGEARGVASGCPADQAVTVLKQAAASGLDPAGVSFHVGSQLPAPRLWRSPIAASARVFEALRASGHRPWLLDLGGGFPAALRGGAPPVALYAAEIDRALRQDFGLDRPRTMASPGRAVVADAGRLVTTVVGVRDHDGTRVLHVDSDRVAAGVFSHDGVVRPVGEGPSGPTGPCVLAGPTGPAPEPSDDDARVRLPLALAEGDRLELTSAGAYAADPADTPPGGPPPVRLVA